LRNSPGRLRRPDPGGGRVAAESFVIGKTLSHYRVIEQIGAGGMGSVYLAEDTKTQTLTKAGLIVGTVPYMSPEQVQGKPIDHRTDIFSLGVILYEMASGHRPFAGETAADISSSILRDAPGPIAETRPDILEPLVRIISRCLEKEPELRYEAIVAKFAA
jgi:serine/threonine protein kinase